jgi:hypothetical protein
MALTANADRSLQLRDPRRGLAALLFRQRAAFHRVAKRIGQTWYALEIGAFSRHGHHGQRRLPPVLGLHGGSMGSNRSVPREVSPRTVITVLRVKRTSQASNREIARRLGIGRSTVDRIVRGKHVSLRDGTEPTLRRCGCGARVLGRCVRCAAISFRQQVAAMMTVFQLLRAGVDFHDPMTRLVVAAAESKSVASWLLTLRGVELRSQRDIPEEVAEELTRYLVPLPKLGPLVRDLLAAAEYVSGETEPMGGQT